MNRRVAGYKPANVALALIVGLVVFTLILNSQFLSRRKPFEVKPTKQGNVANAPRTKAQKCLDTWGKEHQGTFAWRLRPAILARSAHFLPVLHIEGVLLRSLSHQFVSWVAQLTQAAFFLELFSCAAPRGDFRSNSYRGTQCVEKYHGLFGRSHLYRT